MPIQVNFTDTGYVGGIVAAPYVSGSLEQIQHPEWMILPTGDAGEAEITIRAGGPYDGADDLEYRFTPLLSDPDMRWLNDPDPDSWSAWASLGGTTGPFTVTGLGTAPVAVQLRRRVGANYSTALLFKRLGTYFFDYDDSVTTIPGAVAEAIPATVYWGTDNVAGEGRQRVPDDTTAISSGDPSNHFEIHTSGSRKYLRPTSAGVAAWVGGETYSLTLDDSGTTVVSVSILSDTAALASLENALGSASVTEYAAYLARIGNTSGSGDGKTVLLRPGFYDIQGVNGGDNGYYALNLTNPFKLASADPNQKAMIAQIRLFSQTPATDTRKVQLHDLDFFQPSLRQDSNSDYTRPTGATNGNSPVQEIVEIQQTATGSVHDIKRNWFRSDQIEARFGGGLKGAVEAIPVVDCLTMSSVDGCDIQDNVFMYAEYAGFFQGCDGTITKNLTTHIVGDHVRLSPSKVRDTGVAYTHNRHREHVGDQFRIHSDAMHMFDRDGTFDGLTVQGNIFMPGFEGYACPGEYGESGGFAVRSDGSFAWSAVDSNEKQLMTIAGTVTVNTASSYTANNTVAIRNDDPSGMVTVTGPDLPGGGRTLSYLEAASYLNVGGASWQEVHPIKSLQGAPYQNNGDDIWKNTKIADNIIIQNSTQAMLFAGYSAATGNADGSNGLRIHNNFALPLLLDTDLNGDGVVDDRDGAGVSRDAPLAAIALTSKLQAYGTGAAESDISAFKNMTGRVSVPDFAEEWDNQKLGTPGTADTVAARQALLADANGQTWGTMIQTFSQVIEAARVKSGGAAANAYAGAVGPTDGAAGYFNWSTQTHNGYPTLAAKFCYPAQGAAMPDGDSPILFFEYPVVAGPNFSSIEIQPTGGSPITTTTTIDGRKVTFAATMSAGTTYEVIIPADALRHYDEATNDYVGLAAGGFTFTPNTNAYPNILTNLDPNTPANDLSAYLDGTDFALTAGVRFDTIRQGSPVFPSGDGIWSVEVTKGQSCTVELAVTGGTGGNTVNLHTDGTASNTPSGVQDTDWGIIDQTTHWRVWIKGNGSGMTRYYLEVNKDDETVTLRRPLLIDANVPGSIWVSPQATFTQP